MELMMLVPALDRDGSVATCCASLGSLGRTDM